MPRDSERSAALVGRGGGGDDGQVICGRSNHLRLDGDAELGVDDDAQQWAAAGLAATVGEEAIIGEQRSDTGENGVRGVAEALDVGARFLAGDPAGVVLGSGDLAVERQRGLQRHERHAGSHEVREAFVELFRG